MADIVELKSFGDFHGPIMHWAEQTVPWALSHSAQQDANHSDVQHVKAIEAESKRRAAAIWTETVRELGSSLTPSRVNKRFARNVIMWASTYYGDASPANPADEAK